MAKEIGNEYEKYYKRYGDPTVTLHRAYDSWLDDMSTRDGASLKPIPFDPDKFPEQGIYEPKTAHVDHLPLVPDALYYAGFRLKMMRSLGVMTTSKLVDQIKTKPSSKEDRMPVAEKLKQEQAEGKNTLIVTSHLSFPELGYFRALRSIAEDNRPRTSTTDKNAVLLNKLMSRQTYHDKPVAHHFTPVGDVYWSYPKSASSDLHGVPLEARNLGNALFKKAIKPAIKRGGLILDAALTGSEIKPVKDDDGELLYYQIPHIDPASANMTNDFDNMLPVTMGRSPLNGEWVLEMGEIMDLNELRKTSKAAEITDMAYKGIAKSVERITQRDVVYNPVSNK